ncbi:MAG: bifunctional phosphoserine phosphatase/homoserine phosphotransferase ThrH [Pseudomonadaceae bacterium]|nr:bifunctional phosphoserine phosphatase/homoserine phosphotransferase ThrH [Pseudomonadaceae bacterium]
MDILCLDLEGVLIPEIWQAVAAETGVDALLKTTRDIPVYDDLMRMRLEVLEQEGITASTITKVIDTLDPLEGAAEFLDWARQHYQIAILSDTFYEFAAPFMAKLGHPMLLCHRLEIENDRITGYRIRQPDPKRCSVQAFHSLKYRVLAAGDSFNDVPMLQEADVGFFFDAPANVLEQYPEISGVYGYEALKAALIDA